MRSLLSLTAIAVVFACFGSTAAQKQPVVADHPLVRKIDALLSVVEKDGLDGVILIRSRDKVLLHKAYGFADRDAKRPMLVSTGFDIGSIVKPFTKAAILKLEEQGKLTTADTLPKHFSGVPDDKKEITIDQLLTHMAGLPDAFGSDYALVTADELRDKVFAAPLIAKPGEKRSYSNSGYSLLAMIIEKVSGRPYEQFVRDEIFKPAGIRNIGYRSAGWKNGDLAVGFYQGKRWGTPLDKTWAEDGPSWNLRGNGGMLATASDTSAWFEALLEGKVLKADALKKFLATSSGISRALEVRMIGVAGGNDVFNSLQFSVVDSDFHFNFSTSNSTHSAEGLIDRFRDDLYALAREAIGAK